MILRTAPVARMLQDRKIVEPSHLRRAGLKITVPRLKILDILASSQPRHLSAEDVYRRLLAASRPKNEGILRAVNLFAYLST